MTETTLFSVCQMEESPQNNQERELKRSPEFQKVIRELAELQIRMLRRSIENDYATYLSKLQHDDDIPIDTLLHYADTIKFSANSASNDYMQRVRNPYPSVPEMRASLLNKQDMVLNMNTKTVAESVYSQQSAFINGKNELGDMEDDKDDQSVQDMDNDTMSVITQSVFNNAESHAPKQIDWDISDDSDSFSDL
ncbi:hypothetical protein WA588_003454 [Blastocystis sp. NMH]